MDGWTLALVIVVDTTERFFGCGIFPLLQDMELETRHNKGDFREVWRVFLGLSGCGQRD